MSGEPSCVFSFHTTSETESDISDAPLRVATLRGNEFRGELEWGGSVRQKWKPNGQGAGEVPQYAI